MVKLPPAPLQSLDHPWFHTAQNVSVSILRLDLIGSLPAVLLPPALPRTALYAASPHFTTQALRLRSVTAPFRSGLSASIAGGTSVFQAGDAHREGVIHARWAGNKWFKLKENFAAAKRLGYDKVVSFGGPHSNHLRALAAMARMHGIRAIGMVRGHEAMSTQTLQDCAAFGMELHFLSRSEYAKKNEPAFLEALQNRIKQAFIIPEGGANAEGRAGAGSIAAYIPEGATHVCCAAGTGTTFAGIRTALEEHVSMLAFTPMKQGDYLAAEIPHHLPPEKNVNWRIVPEYHFGGFGKMTETLKAFMHDAFRILQLPLDRVYTAKMLYGIKEMLANGKFPEGSNIVIIHTGGLQGNAPGDLPPC